MLTQKLIAAVGLAGVLLMGVSADAAADSWCGHCAPVYRAPVVVAPPVYLTLKNRAQPTHARLLRDSAPGWRGRTRPSLDGSQRGTRQHQ